MRPHGVGHAQAKMLAPKARAPSMSAFLAAREKDEGRGASVVVFESD